ncbi:large conductance mechanosensitive channel protein MscL [Melissococcus plutonius]|uniref:Large-conductance mechanosensitive channel n=2 Tax=Melissococcus plutonius TaxID=33970 RepID=F3Y7Z2_MELPT|nr:large conductance mechanosensitive channel protein MscL [Melissococcus plutonius]BAL61418.1 large-conductance mechano sensitive channel protein [Melissococcus plutonius DAT561]AIM24374.1 large-conductance mechano sensitive channel protein [Melissococcus plutonius S1]KMT25764.1 large-conductance mechano sensitive channel protein [Melissococcus plutonius]KMT27109.1 large-conductance mechano sensitive channel protein [Melissococcus plutonius]KMT28210.1 large-conductance mechano sensitive chann
MLKEFKQFIMQGSVLNLAIGVVMGSAFTAIVTRVVDGLITPLISLIFVLITHKKNADQAFGSMVFSVEGVQFRIGDVISAVVTFLITAFVLFIVVKLANKIRKQQIQPPPESVSDTKSEGYLEDIRNLLMERQQNKNN